MHKIAILTEGSESVGYGHIVRCSIFYDALLNLGNEVEFIIKGDSTVGNILLNKNFKIYDWQSDLANCIFYLNNFDAIILDSININQKDVNKLCGNNFVLLTIDDYKRNKYKGAIVLDWTINLDKNNKHIHNSNDNILLLGLKYAIVRNPFLIKTNRIPKQTVENVLLMMGGTDIRGLTNKIMNCILVNFTGVSLHIVANKNININEEFNKRVFLYSNIDANELSNVMNISDVAISAGGQTLYELAAQIIPTIAIQVTDNQNEDIIGWVELGLISEVIDWDDKLIYDKIIQGLKNINSFEKREQIYNKVRNQIRNDSVNLILEVLTKKINDNNRK